jgi:hypothetical protein
LDLDLCADFDSELVWFLALLADLEKKLHYRFGGPEEVQLISEQRLLRSGERLEEKINRSYSDGRAG